jgi:hypothetical protein
MAQPGEPVLVSIGDISVTQSQVFTPSGVRPLSEVSWTVTDMTTTTQAIPTWAIVCAIVFFVFCLLGLLFLLVKETKTQGSMQVTVHGPGFVHTSQIPVSSPAQVADINARVNHARMLAASVMPGQQPGQPIQPGWGAQPGQPGQPGQQGQPGQPGWPGQQPGWPGQQPGWGSPPGEQGFPGQEPTQGQ